MKIIIFNLIISFMFGMTINAFALTISPPVPQIALTSHQGDVIGVMTYEKGNEIVTARMTPSAGYNVELKERVSIDISDQKGTLLHYDLQNVDTGEKYTVYIAVTDYGVSAPLNIVGSREFPRELPQISIKAIITEDKYNKIVRGITIRPGEIIVPHIPPKASGNLQNLYLPMTVDITDRVLGWRQDALDFQRRVRSARGANYDTRVMRARIKTQKQINDWLNVVVDNIEDTYKLGNAQWNMDGAAKNISNNALKSSSENDRREIRKEYRNFLKSLRTSRIQPSFSSEFLNKSIDFDLGLSGDKKALQTYAESFKEMRSLPQKTKRFHELQFSQHMIETRQDQKENFDREVLDNLNKIASSINEGNTSLLISSIEFFSKSDDFQKGLATSIVNNINPLSFVYPLENSCKTKWCELGETFGDASSMLLGAVEFIGGIALAEGGGWLVVAGTVATSSGVIPAAIGIPVGTAAVIEGLVLAGHGSSVFVKSFGRMYDRISGYFNKIQIVNSNKSVNSARKSGLFNSNRFKELKSNSSYETVKSFFRELDGVVLLPVKKRLVRSFDLKTIREKVLDKDLIVYRWHNNNDYSSQLGRFVSENPITDKILARKMLALPPENQMLVFEKFRIPKGTKVFKGKVAPLHGHSGGGNQVFITGQNINELLLPIVD